MRKFFIILFVFMLFPLFFLFFLIDLPARRIINNEMENIKEKGEPINLSEIFLEKRILNPELDEKIKDFLKKIEKQDKEIRKIICSFFTSDGYDRKVLKEIKKQNFIEKQQEFIECCKYIIDNFHLTNDEKSIKQYISLFAPLYIVSNIVRVRCIINATENNKNKVIDDIFLMAKITEFTNHPVNLFTFNYSCLIYENMARCINNILNVLSFDKNSLEIIEKNLPYFNSQIYKSTIFRERAIYNKYFEDLMEGKKGFSLDAPFFLFSDNAPYEDPTKKFISSPFGIYLKPIIRHNKGMYLYFFRKLIDVENLPLKDRKRYLEEIRKEIENLPKYDFLFIFSDLKDIARFYENFLIAKTHENLLFTSISIEKYRKKKGFLPEKIERIGLHKNRIIDPFADKMLNYKIEKEGYKIWSVGINRKEEGGMYLSYGEKRKKGYKKDDKDDIIWIIKK